MFRKIILFDSCFVFNNKNFKRVIRLSINKSVNSVEELEKLCYDKFIGNTTLQNNQKCSPYKELTKALNERDNAFLEGKVSSTGFLKVGQIAPRGAKIR